MTQQGGLYLLLISSVIVSIPLFYYLRFLPNLFSQQSIKVLSKEYFISLNNVLFLTGIFIIFLGVLYPLFMEFFFDDRISVGAPYYNLLLPPLSFCLAVSTMVLSTESLWSSKFFAGNFKRIFDCHYCQPLLSQSS